MGTDEGGANNNITAPDGQQPATGQQPTTRREQQTSQAPQRQFQGNRTWIPIPQPKGKSTKCRICGKIFHEGETRAKNPNTAGHYRCTTCIPKNHNMAREQTQQPTTALLQSGTMG
eukprot:495294-Prorocentrum_lima.AAC.1